MSQFTLSADGSTTPFDFRGQATVSAQGAFSGDVITIEASMDGGVTFYALTDSAGADGTFTENGSLNIDHAKCKLRFTMSSTSGATIKINFESFSNQG
jgi:hypothetical protein